jgi:ammonia channel protein AmtB
VQLAAVGATAALAALGTAAILLTLRWVTGLRPAQLGEARGMDAIEHGEVAYALGTASLRLLRPSVNSWPVSARGSYSQPG